MVAILLSIVDSVRAFTPDAAGAPNPKVQGPSLLLTGRKPDADDQELTVHVRSVAE